MTGDEFSLLHSLGLNPEAGALVENFVLALRRRQYVGSPFIYDRVFEVIRIIIASCRWQNTESLFRTIKSVGRLLQEAQPVEMAIANCVRRILAVLRNEACAECCTFPDCYCSVSAAEVTDNSPLPIDIVAALGLPPTIGGHETPCTVATVAAALASAKLSSSSASAASRGSSNSGGGSSGSGKSGGAGSGAAGGSGNSRNSGSSSSSASSMTSAAALALRQRNSHSVMDQGSSSQICISVCNCGFGATSASQNLSAPKKATTSSQQQRKRVLSGINDGSSNSRPSINSIDKNMASSFAKSAAIEGKPIICSKCSGEILPQSRQQQQSQQSPQTFVPTLENHEHHLFYGLLNYNFSNCSSGNGTSAVWNGHQIDFFGQRKRRLDYSRLKPQIWKSVFLNVLGDACHELQSINRDVSQQGSSHIHSNEVILTYGMSVTAAVFFKDAALKRRFQVVIAEAAPTYSGQEFALMLLGKANKEYKPDIIYTRSQKTFADDFLPPEIKFCCPQTQVKANFGIDTNTQPVGNASTFHGPQSALKKKNSGGSITEHEESNSYILPSSQSSNSSAVSAVFNSVNLAASGSNIVSEPISAPQCGLEITIIPDAAVTAVMSRINKVIIGTHMIFANGGLLAPAGTLSVAIAAKHYSIPVVVVTGIYKLTVLHPSNDQDAFNMLTSPSKICSYAEDDLADGDLTELACPMYDYVPPELVTLFVTDDGSYAPSYMYRLLMENYSAEDDDFAKHECLSQAFESSEKSKIFEKTESQKNMASTSTEKTKFKEKRKQKFKS